MQLLGISATLLILGCLPLCFGKCPDSKCPGDEVCVTIAVLHLCRHPGKEGDLCTGKKDANGVYKRYPPCESGLYCSDEIVTVCKKS